MRLKKWATTVVLFGFIALFIASFLHLTLQMPRNALIAFMGVVLLLIAGRLVGKAIVRRLGERHPRLARALDVLYVLAGGGVIYYFSRYIYPGFPR